MCALSENYFSNEVRDLRRDMLQPRHGRAITLLYIEQIIIVLYNFEGSDL